MDLPSLLCETARYNTSRINSTKGFQACALGPGRQRWSEYYRKKINKILVNQKCDLRKIQNQTIKTSDASMLNTSCKLNIKHFFHAIISHLLIILTNILLLYGKHILYLIYRRYLTCWQYWFWSSGFGSWANRISGWQAFYWFYFCSILIFVADRVRVRMLENHWYCLLREVLYRAVSQSGLGGSIV